MHSSVRKLVLTSIITAAALCLCGFVHQGTAASDPPSRNTPASPLVGMADDSGSDCPSSPISPDDVKKHVVELADDSYEGRGAGYPGEKKAANYISQQFKEIGLLPYGDKVQGGRLYFQGFRFRPQQPPKPWDVFTSRNVVGFLEGEDKTLKEEVVVVGAHFDGQGKLGQANPDRLVPGGELKHDIWNSADDNASSVAALIEIARSLSKRRPRRSFLFIAFSAEEYALNGSISYVASPSIAWKRHVAMINLEKLGRIPEQSLITASTSTSKIWDDVTSRANALTGERVSSAISEIISDTDHYPFAALKVPAITIGMAHQIDTHLPTDTADKIAYDALAKRATYIRCFVRLVGDLDSKPRFSGKIGRDLGMLVLVPSDAERESVHAGDVYGALEISALVPGLPAAKAHLEEGDLITAVNGVPLSSKGQPKDAVQVVADKAKVNSIEVTIIRNGQILKRKIRLPN